MKKFYSLAIPEPCHENWNSMTPNEKGRFCDSCSKTVIDFTNMTVKEIQEYIHENKQQRICGHIRQDQLDKINLRIPERIFHQQLSFHKAFLLALLLTMGTTLLSCSNGNGKVQKINSVEVVSYKENEDFIVRDSIENDLQIPITGRINNAIETDSTKKEKIEDIIELDGEIVMIEGDIRFEEYDPTLPIPWSIVENLPEFKDMPSGLSIQEKRKYFSDKIGDFVKSNFNMENTTNIGLKGRQRIYVQFTIDSLGYADDVKVRAPHPKIEEDVKQIITFLPQFIPANQDGKNVAVIYSLPIIFDADN